MMIYKKVSPGLLYIFIVLIIKTTPLFYENMLSTKLSTLLLLEVHYVVAQWLSSCSTCVGLQVVSGQKQCSSVIIGTE